MGACVVGRVDRQFGFGQRLGVVAGGEAGRRVDAQRHPFVQAVVNHPGDLFAVAFADRLVLDHRGDRDHVEGRQVLRAGVAHVDPGDAVLEVFELQLHQFGGAGVLLQFAGVGKEKALKVLGVLAPVFSRVEVLGAHAGLLVAATQASLLGDFGGLRARVALGDRQRDRLEDDGGRRGGAFVEVLVGKCRDRGGAEQDRNEADCHTEPTAVRPRRPWRLRACPRRCRCFSRQWRRWGDGCRHGWRGI